MVGSHRSKNKRLRRVAKRPLNENPQWALSPVKHPALSHKRPRAQLDRRRSSGALHLSAAARRSLCPTSKIICPLSRLVGYKKHLNRSQEGVSWLHQFHHLCYSDSVAWHHVRIFNRDFRHRFISPLSDGSVHKPRPTHDGSTAQVHGELGSSTYSHLPFPSKNTQTNPLIFASFTKDSNSIHSFTNHISAHLSHEQARQGPQGGQGRHRAHQ